MKTIFGNKRVLLGISGIAVALMLVVGSTFAWFLVGGTPGGVTDPGTVVGGSLDVKSLGFYMEGPENSVGPQHGLQPGDLWDEEGYIENVGTLDAVIEIPLAKVTLTRNSQGIALPQSEWKVADKNLYKAEYSVLPQADQDTDTYYVSNAPQALAVPVGALKVVTNMKLSKDNPLNKEGRDRYFLFFTGAGEYYVYDNNGDPIWENGKWKTQIVDSVRLKVHPILDFKTYAKDMDASWMGARLEGFRVVATQTYEEAIVDTFLPGTPYVEDEFLDALEWADSSGPFQLRSRQITPAEFLKSVYSVQ